MSEAKEMRYNDLEKHTVECQYNEAECDICHYFLEARANLIQAHKILLELEKD